MSFALPHRSVRALPLALALLVGLGCGDTTTARVNGKLEFGRETVDFGYVIVGQQKELRLPVRNNGPAELRISAIVEGEGFPDEFDYAPQRLTLASGAEETLTFFFQPTAEGLREGELVFQIEDQKTPVRLDVRGVGIVADLRAEPADVEFGPVIVEDLATRTSVVTNHGDAPLEILVEPLGGDRPELFHATVPGNDQRMFTLGAGESADLTFTFQPVAVGAVTAALTLRACAGCNPLLIRLGGKGIAAGIVPEPEELDFGAVLPRTTGTKTLTLRNVGNRRIAVTAMRPAQAGTEFSVAQPSGGWPDLEPGEWAEVAVTYAPLAFGADVSAIIVETDDARAPRFDVRVRGLGGGPDIDAAPALLNWGDVGIGFPITRRLTVTNKGINDATGDADDLLVSAIELHRACPTEAEPEKTCPVPEFQWALPGGIELPVRIQPGSRQIVEVRFDPEDVGLEDATLVLVSNDGDEARFGVPLRANGLLLPPCDYELVPAADAANAHVLDFGVVPRGRFSRLPFSIRNLGTSKCVIGRIELTAETPAAFTLPEGEVFGRTLEVGERLVTEVEFSPPGTTPAAGADFAGGVHLSMSSTAAPEKLIQLTGRGGEVCLSITPAGVDFGVVKPQCETNDRTFTIHNACRSAVKVNAIRIGSGAGEFHVIAPPNLPRSVNVGDQLQFNVRYRACDVGVDAGTVEIETDQTVTNSAGGRVPYVVTLAGRSEVDATMVETFRQADRARADILFVVDDSGSMSEEQETLGREFDSFMRFARSQQIDYRLAVTTTDMDGGAEGRFVHASGHPAIVSPLTPDPEESFRANVNIGTNGSGDEQGLEAAYRALSDPLVNGANAGFLRPDAYLSVIVVSDEEDSSPRAVDFYSNFFSNIKGPRGQNLVSVSGIVGKWAENAATPSPGTSGTCSGAGGSADWGWRYITTAQRTNGITESICNGNWSTALEKLGLIAFGFKSRFILTSEPDPASIKVFLDGQEIPRGTFWTYTNASNSIDFLPIAVPPASSEIRVSYEVACTALSCEPSAP